MPRTIETTNTTTIRRLNAAIGDVTVSLTVVQGAKGDAASAEAIFRQLRDAAAESVDDQSLQGAIWTAWSEDVDTHICEHRELKRSQWETTKPLVIIAAPGAHAPEIDNACRNYDGEQIA